MKIHLQYFASLREQRGLNSETITTDLATIAAVYDELKQHHGLSLERDMMRVAVGDRFVSWDTPLTDDMTITFIPPVAGG